MRSLMQNAQAVVETRWRIVTFMKVSKGDERFTAKQTPCDIRLVRRVWAKYCATGTVNDAKRSGRPTLISRVGAKLALEKLLRAGNSGSASVAQELAAAGITNKVVHKTTVIRAAKKAAYDKGKMLLAKRGPPPKGLRQTTKAKRLAFAQANKNRNWKLVMFTDRKRFYLKYPGSKVPHCRWVLEGEEGWDVFQPTNPLCVNVYAGITPYGLTAMHIVAGTSKHKTVHKTQLQKPARNITKSEYKEVLMETLLPEGTKLFKKAGVTSWILQQDGDRSHGVANQVLQQWNVGNGASVQLLPSWPPSSPDLNIIENVWGWVQVKVNQKGCKDFDEFKQAVQETFAAVPQHVIDNLYNSLKKRMELVVESVGAYTKY